MTVARDQWMDEWRRRALPALDWYLKTAIRQAFPDVPSQAQESLIGAIRTVIVPVVDSGDESHMFRLSGRDDADMARILEPFVTQILSFRPNFLRVFVGYEALSRFGFAANILSPISYIGGRCAEHYAPSSYKVLESLVTTVDQTQFACIRKLLGYTNQDGSGVLLRQQYDVAGILYRMAMSADAGWPGTKDKNVCQWATDYIKALHQWVNDRTLWHEIANLRHKLGQDDF